MKEFKKIIYIFVGFLSLYLMPLENTRFSKAIFESLALDKWYALSVNYGKSIIY
ncbi:hypothetical protein ACFL96_05600 [Thermoproteota archaeon]